MKARSFVAKSVAINLKNQRKKTYVNFVNGKY